MALTGEQIRWLLIAAVFAVALSLCLFFGIKRRWKDIALTVLCASLVTCFLTVSTFHSVSEYGSGSLAPAGEGDPVVTLEIDASAAGKGFLLPPTQVALREGETVLELLLRVTEAKNLRIETSGGYVEGIGGLYEFDHGDQSGWIYAVNGASAGVSAADYLPKDGDVISWRYVTSFEGRGETS